MQTDGSYLREPGGEGTSSQEALYQYFSKRKVSLDEGDAAEEKKEEKTEKKAPEAEKTDGVWEKFKKLFV